MLTISVILPLVITLVIETGIYMILRHRDLKLFLVVSTMNLILNPTMNIMLIVFGDTPMKYWIILSVGEVLTTLIESLIVYAFMKFKYLKILLFAVTANLASFLIGLAFEPLYGNKMLLIVSAIIFMLVYIAIYLVVLISFIKKNRAIES